MRLKFLMTGLAASVLLTACGAKDGASSAVNGAGSSFIAPLFGKWAADYNKETGVQVNYQSVGSGAGIDQIKKKTVDFGASDAPMKADELAAAGLVQFPSAMGGVVAVYNIKDLKQALVFNGAVLGDIYAGKIKKWNDPAIVALNKDANLPNEDNKVVRRADGSGTTYLFTEYLAKTNETWKAIGANKEQKWMEGSIGGKGNEGVATNVKQFEGSIGYVEYAYAKKNGITSASMINKDGKTVAPSAETFAAAAEKADWSVPGMAASLTDVAGEKAWPITGTAFVLMHTKPENSANSLQVLKFLDWGYTKGQTQASELDYIPLPANVVDLIKNEWKKITDASGKALM